MKKTFKQIIHEIWEADMEYFATVEKIRESRYGLR